MVIQTTRLRQRHEKNSPQPTHCGLAQSSIRRWMQLMRLICWALTYHLQTRLRASWAHFLVLFQPGSSQTGQLAAASRAVWLKCSPGSATRPPGSSMAFCFGWHVECSSCWVSLVPAPFGKPLLHDFVLDRKVGAPSMETPKVGLDGVLSTWSGCSYFVWCCMESGVGLHDPYGPFQLGIILYNPNDFVIPYYLKNPPPSTSLFPKVSSLLFISI